MSDYRDINSLNTTPTALITGGDKVPFYNTGDAYAYAMTLDQLQSWVLSGGTIDPTFDDVSADTVTITGTTGNTLVVDTNTFVVDATNDSVGIGTTSPSSFARFAVLSGATANTAFLASTTANAYSTSSFFSGWSLALRSAANATGNATAIRFASSANGAYEGLFGFVQNASTYGDFVWQSYNGSYGERMRLDASGNLGLGVTPSAWSASFKALQVSTASLWSSGGSNALIGANYYHDGTNRRYISTAAATEYGQSGGSHIWYTAPSGTAGNAISFTQAMTLDASGNLGVGETSPTARIHAKTTANIQGIFEGTSQGAIRIRGTSPGFQLYSNAAGVLGFYDDNSSAVRLTIKSAGQVRFAPLAADPSGAEAGDVYYNSGTNKLKVYNGTSWVDLH